jgi:hypothetical protein
MMAVNLIENPILLTVGQLLINAQYIIPLYQRNYAWSKIEIEQLLIDIWNKVRVDDTGAYYIGTLVVNQKPDGRFEIIDGQQRYTALTMIKAVIAFIKQTQQVSFSNLYFEGRPGSQLFLESLFSEFELTLNTSYAAKSQQNLQQAVKDVIGFFRSGTIPTQQLDGYFRYFETQVQIIRVAVPEGTDINHYFEIMNNRGEQLEPHEILKARFLESLQDQPETLRKSFAEIWDACSQMDRHVQMAFNTEHRSAFFGSDWQSIPSVTLFRGLPEELKSGGSEKDTLAGIIAMAERSGQPGVERPLQESKFRSVIDFPNFLLQVLQLLLPEEVISLDDKSLLSEFGCIPKSRRELPDAIRYINHLLYYRACFDRYIIKREEGSEDWNWKLLRLNTSENQGYLNTFDDQQKLVMIQAMFHVSQPANTYKTWLQHALRFFNNVAETNLGPFFDYLEAYSRARLAGEVDLLDQGTGTPLYIFNLLDYRLWAYYYEGASADAELGRQIGLAKKAFEGFRFTQNNSVEHVAPQHPRNNEPTVELLNDFGNLCLISRGTNSRLGNLGFHGKKEHFNSPTRSGVESLKQAIIFTYADWGDRQIGEHGRLMKTLMFPSLGI